MSTDLIQRLDTAYKSCLPAGDLWNLCEEAANELERLAAVEAERDQLRAEVVALRADAERYRWLAKEHGWWLLKHFPAQSSYVDASEVIDAAIDAARKG